MKRNQKATLLTLYKTFCILSLNMPRLTVLEPLKSFSIYFNSIDSNRACNIVVPTKPANIGPQDVPRTPPPTSPGRPLKIIFDHPEDAPNLTSWIRPNLTLVGCPWEVDSGPPLEGLQSIQTWMSQHFL